MVRCLSVMRYVTLHHESSVDHCDNFVQELVVPPGTPWCTPCEYGTPVACSVVSPHDFSLTIAT